MEITGIPDSVPDQNLEEKVVDILNEISVDVSPKDIEARHRVGYQRKSSKKTIACFINRKHEKKALISRKILRKSSSPNRNVFINENLTVKSNKIAFLSRKLVVVILIKYIQEAERSIFQVKKYTEEKY